MASFNKVILMGNLTRDPQLRYLPSNTAVCEFGLAVNHRWRDRDGNQREEVCFVDVAAFGRQAELINQYMAKGRAMLLEGRLKFDTWTGQDGQKRSKHSVVVDNFQFVGSRAGGGQEGSPAGGYDRGRNATAGGYDRDAAAGDFSTAEPPPSDNDIPF